MSDDVTRFDPSGLQIIGTRQAAFNREDRTVFSARLGDLHIAETAEIKCNIVFYCDARVGSVGRQTVDSFRIG